MICFYKSKKTIAFFLSLSVMMMLQCRRGDGLPGAYVIDDHGALIRMDTTKPVIYLAFTGHDLAEGFPVVHSVLKKQDIRASFFLTGDFYRNPSFEKMIRTLVSEGHYLGAHSDKHLLYCSWEKRDSLLVDKETFLSDLEANYREMQPFGITKEQAVFFMPPYEWYNRAIAGWTAERGLVLVNFSPGTRSNADYTYPQMGKGYVNSDTIMRNILTYEKENGMHGFILLIHPGTDPRRPDKLYNRLDEMVSILKDRGYSFARFPSGK